MSKKRTRLENKEIHAKRLADERKLALLEALAEKNDPVFSEVKEKCNKMEKTVECSVCGEEFRLKKDSRYTACVKGMITNRYFDCYDCPNCGAQHVAKERYEKYAENF